MKRDGKQRALRKLCREGRVTRKQPSAEAVKSAMIGMSSLHVNSYRVQNRPLRALCGKDQGQGELLLIPSPPHTNGLVQES